MYLKIEKSEGNNEDIEYLATTTQINGLGNWFYEDFKNAVKNSDFYIVIAKSEAEKIGFLFARNISEESELLNIFVSQKFRNKGIGNKLINNYVNLLKDRSIEKIWLEVRESNSVAIKFYKNIGFVNCNVRKNYYSEPVENAIIMYLNIKN